MRNEARRSAAALTGLVMACFVSLSSASPGVPSSAAANSLVTLMTSKGLDSFALQDPTAPDRFVAAMLVPDVQLLVVAATSRAPEYLRDQLRQHQYREVYAGLFSGAVPESRLFFQDMGCDGLSLAGSGNTDIMYERGTVQTVFDGDWKRQKLSKEQYDEKLRKADAEYGRLLQLLTDGVKAEA
jgi:hypothetical protein